MNGIDAEENARAREGAGFLDDEEGVGCGALQTALVDLDRALVRDRCHAVVSAPAGPGRGRLLDALAERLAGPLEVVVVEPSLLRGEDVCSRILDALDERSEVDPEMRLLSVLQGLGARGSALALLIDDAGSLPAANLRRLGRLAALSRPDLRLALVVVDDPDGGGSSLAQVVGSLGVSAEKVVLGSRPGGGGRSSEPPARPRPPELPLGPEARAHEERALEAMRLAGGSGAGAIRSLAALGLGLILALIGANQIAFQALDPLASETPQARPEPGFPIEPMLARVASGVAHPAAAPAGLQTAALEAPEPESPAPVSLGTPAPRPRSLAVAPKPQPGAAGPQRVAPAPTPAQVAAAPPMRRVPVSVNARPWARIEVDGREVGVTPLGNVPLEPGPHRFRAHLPDGRVVERTTDVDAHRDHVVFP